MPRRVSGPAAVPAQRRLAPRRATATKGPVLERLAAALRSLPDHRLLDRVVHGRAWIPLLGVMLVGIVAVQLELLKLNATTGRSIELISSLQSRNDALRAHVAAASDPGRIERLASHMGMTMPGPESISFLRARSASVRRALAGMHLPDIAAFQAALQVSNVPVALPNPSTTPQPRGPRTNTTTGTQGTTTTTSTQGATATTGAQGTTTTAATSTATPGANATATTTAGAVAGTTSTTTTTTSAAPPTTTAAQSTANAPPAPTVP